MHMQPKCLASLASLYMGVAHLVTEVCALVFGNSTLLAVWLVPSVAVLLQGTPSLAAELTA